MNKNKKTFAIIMQPKKKGGTTARAYRVKQEGERAHNFNLIGLIPFRTSSVPKDPEYRDYLIKKWLEKHSHINGIEDENFYLEVV